MCTLNEMILRQMILLIDPKLVETMLSLAKGEHAIALHNIQEEPGEETAGVTGAEDVPASRGANGRRPRSRSDVRINRMCS